MPTLSSTSATTETKPAHDAQANQARLVLLGQNFQRNTDRLGAADKLSPVGCFAQRARAGCPDSSDPMLVRGGFKILQHTQRRFDRLRLEQRKKRVNPYPDEAPADGMTTGPQEAMELEQQSRLLRSAVSELSRLERQAIETAFFSELTYAQAAARLNEPLGTVKTRIRSGLQKLRAALADGWLP